MGGLIRFIQNDSSPRTSITKNSSVIAIGNFDGLHLGHRQILSACVTKAKERNENAIALTFEPHPKCVLGPQANSHKLLMTNEMRYQKMFELGIDAIAVADFSFEFSKIKPSVFIEMILINQLNPSVIYTGGDFRFGAMRHGDVNLLHEAAHYYGFTYIPIGHINYRSEPISSSRIKRYLSQYRITGASAMLGESYSINCNKVQAYYALNTNLHYPPSASYMCIINHGCEGIWALAELDSAEHKLHLYTLNKVAVATWYESDTSSVTLKQFLHPKREYQTSQEHVNQIYRDIKDCIYLVKSLYVS